MIRPAADRVRAVLALLGPVGAGSRVLLLRLLDRFGWKTVGAGALVVVYVAARYRAWVIWLVIGWCAAALVHAPKPPSEPGPEAVEEAEDLAVETTGREPIRRLMLDLMGEGHGVHLKTVLAYLQEHGQWKDKRVADLRVHLEALGIPVDPKLKVNGVPTRGVLRADLEALSPPMETSPSPDPSTTV